MTIEPTAIEWVVLAVAALIVGVSKAALPGAATIAVSLFAAVLPAKQSTAMLLLLLIVGDMFALWAYRRHAEWKVLLRLVPVVVAGVLAGVLFLAYADDSWVRRVIGVILLVLIAVTLWRRYRANAGAASAEATPGSRANRVSAGVYGVLGGFTTMVANAGGPVMSMYFVAMRFPVMAFLGTSAWFFALVNLGKVPFAIGLGLLDWNAVRIDLWLVPVVVIGAFIGRAIAGKLSQALFDRLVIVLTVAGALYLLV